MSRTHQQRARLYSRIAIVCFSVSAVGFTVALVAQILNAIFGQ